MDKTDLIGYLAKGWPKCHKGEQCPDRPNNQNVYSVQSTNKENTKCSLDPGRMPNVISP